MKKIYVAGASREVSRARTAMGLLRGAGFEVAHDWVRVVEHHEGNANFGLTDEVRLRESKACADMVLGSDALWLLLPEVETIGAWVELGLFMSLNRTPIVVSGKAPDRTIFTSLARHFETDAAAVSYFAHEF